MDIGIGLPRAPRARRGGEERERVREDVQRRHHAAAGARAVREGRGEDLRRGLRRGEMQAQGKLSGFPIVS